MLEAALEREHSPELFDSLGQALWWLGDARGSLRRREAAYGLFRRRGRDAEAASLAVDIAICYLTSFDNYAAASGWIARAERYAAHGGPLLQGWVTLMQGYMAEDGATARILMERALDIGREARDEDLELVALADLGLVLVSGGETTDGLKLLDEAMAGTLGGDFRRLETVVWTSCSMLAACRLVNDLRRATEWCAAADTFMETYGCPFLQARCRAHYGAVLLATGRWELAEVELRRALDMAHTAGRGPRSEALAALAELHQCRGRPEEAETLLGPISDTAEAAVPWAATRLALGQPDEAIAVLTDHLERAGATSALARFGGRAPDGTIEQARYLHATGLVAAAHGNAAACASLRASLDAFLRAEVPFEAARVRLDLARALSRCATDRAVLEATRALETFRKLGASSSADAARALLRALGVATGPGPRTRAPLTRRELEVLALVQAGATNREIAGRLYLSPKTVAHHVSSILSKLQARTRAEAAALAARERAGICGRPADRLRSGEVRTLVAGALELVEAGSVGDEEYAVPQPAGGLALRGRRHDRAEERHALDTDHRCPDIHADLVHPGVV